MRHIAFALVVATLVLVRPAWVSAQPSIEVAFSPHGRATEVVVKLIGEAKQTIRVAAYSFTSKDIAQALIEAHKRGVDVEVVLDKSNNTAKYISTTFLANEGIPTRIDYQYAIMHNKFMVVDGVTVEKGSFNYTKAAEEHNAENVLILRNAPDVAKTYLTRWAELWEESEEYSPKY